jgi:hypothetical protein
MKRATLALAAGLLITAAAAAAQNLQVAPDLLPSKPTLDLRGQDSIWNWARPYFPGDAKDLDLKFNIKTCPACMTPGEVVKALSIGAKVYGGTLYQMPGQLGVDNTAIFGLHAAQKSVGLYNSSAGKLEFKVASQSAAAPRVVDLGPSEILTVDCDDCHAELELSIETTGQPVFVSRYDGGTIVVPQWNGTRWELSVLGED